MELNFFIPLKPNSASLESRCVSVKHEGTLETQTLEILLTSLNTKPNKANT